MLSSCQDTEYKRDNWGDVIHLEDFIMIPFPDYELNTSIIQEQICPEDQI